jgi:hypothetical protein
MWREHVAAILKRNRIEPAPERSRKTTSKEISDTTRELIVAATYR